MAERTLKPRRALALTILNAIKGDASKMDELVSCQNVTDLQNLSFLGGMRPFDNMNGMSDKEMSLSQPKMSLVYRSIYSDGRYDVGLTRGNFNYQANPVRYMFERGVRFATPTPQPSDPLLDIYANKIEWLCPVSLSIKRCCFLIEALADTSTNTADIIIRTNLNNVDGIGFGGINGNMSIRYINDDDEINTTTEFIQTINGDSRELKNSTGSVAIRSGNPTWEWSSDTRTTSTPIGLFSTLLFGANPFNFLNFDIELESNAWVFSSVTDCDNYLRTGDYTRAVNYNPDPIESNTDDEKKWYIYTDVNRSAITEPTFYETNKLEVIADNISSERPIVGYVVKSNTPYNVKLKIENANIIKSMREAIHNGGWNDTFPQTFANVYSYLQKGKRKAGSYYYTYVTRTNIPIFGSEADADKYLNYEIDEESAINDLTPTETETNIGTEKDASELNDTSINIALSKTLVMQYSALAEVGRTLYNEQDITEILDGLKLMGETPLNFICDLFALPFNPLPFCESAVNNTMLYGTYSVQMANSFNEVLHTNKILTMFSVPIVGTYNDWRDFMQNYYLYLPFVGITAIDIEKYMYKTMTCKVQFDVRTGTIKYYLSANGVNMDTFEGSVRISMPIIGTNNFASTMSKIGAVSNIASTVASAGVGGAGALMGAEVQKVAKGLNGQKVFYNENTGSVKDWGMSMGAQAPSIIGDSIANIQTLTSATPKHCSGNFSSQTATMDELTAYLIIDAKEIIYPQTIQTNYNLPDNRVGKIGSCIGYTQVDSVDLKCKCNESEYNNIIALLQGGFYV